MFFSQSLLLLLVGNSPLFSFDALLPFNLLLSFFFLLFQLLGLLSRVVVITVGWAATRAGTSSLFFLLLLVLLLLFYRNFGNDCRIYYDDLFGHHDTRQRLILRRFMLVRSVCNNGYSCAAIPKVHISLECLWFCKISMMAYNLTIACAALHLLRTTVRVVRGWHFSDQRLLSCAKVSHFKFIARSNAANST